MFGRLWHIAWRWGLLLLCIVAVVGILTGQLDTDWMPFEDLGECPYSGHGYVPGC